MILERKASLQVTYPFVFNTSLRHRDAVYSPFQILVGYLMIGGIATRTHAKRDQQRNGTQGKRNSQRNRSRRYTAKEHAKQKKIGEKKRKQRNRQEGPTEPTTNPPPPSPMENVADPQRQKRKKGTKIKGGTTLSC